MLIAQCTTVLVGFVLLVQGHSLYGGYGGCTGCGLCGGNWNSWGSSSSACGLGSGESMCDGKRIIGDETGKNCAPLVVRPQAIPKPVLPLPVSLAPVPGPCICKKVIVKPAVLPKPICRATGKTIGGYGYGCAGAANFINTCNYNHNINCHSSTILDGTSAVVGGCNYGSSDYHQPIVLAGNVGCHNQANFAPADAVSIALAHQKAQEQCLLTNSEDRLTFGFRKIPQELPRQIITKENIPEERIFGLNGQIVELKPINVCVQKTLDEEAAEDLMALQEEEHASDTVNQYGGYRRISLGEIGYGPAKLEKKTFVDVPASAIDAAADAAAGAADNALESVGGAIGSAISAAGSALGLGSDGCNSGFVSGNVVYKTVPKPKQICLPIPQDTTDCESEEEPQSFSSEKGIVKTTCGVCCMPCCSQNIYKQSHSSSSSSTCKKSNLLIERLCHEN